MGRGEAKRRRIRNQLKAQEELVSFKMAQPCLNSRGLGHLLLVKDCHTDQHAHTSPYSSATPQGKRPSKQKPQTEPKKKKQTPDKDDALPASLRRMLQLKQAAEQRNQRAEIAKNGPSSLGQHQNQQTDYNGTKSINSNKKNGKVDPSKPKSLPKVHSAFDEEKKLKSSKKEYLQKKKMLKKKGSKLQSTSIMLPKRDADDSSEEEVVDKEKLLLARGIASKPSFGEVAHQPLSLNLKRKHWNDQKAATDSERCKKLFVEQLYNAKKMAMGQGVEKSSKRFGKVVDKRKDTAVEAVRQQVIDNYRDIKKKKLEQEGRKLVTSATAASLAALVVRGNKNI